MKSKSIQKETFKQNYLKAAEKLLETYPNAGDFLGFINDCQKNVHFLNRDVPELIKKNGDCYFTFYVLVNEVVCRWANNPSDAKNEIAKGLNGFSRYAGSDTLNEAITQLFAAYGVNEMDSISSPEFMRKDLAGFQALITLYEFMASQELCDKEDAKDSPSKTSQLKQAA